MCPTEQLACWPITTKQFTFELIHNNSAITKLDDIMTLSRGIQSIESIIDDSRYQSIPIDIN